MKNHQFGIFLWIMTESRSFMEDRLPPSALAVSPRRALHEKHYNGLKDPNLLEMTDEENYTQLREKDHPKAEEGRSSTKSFTILGLIFLASIVTLGIVYLNFPNLRPEEKEHIKLPRNIDDAKNLGKVLSRYKEDHYYEVLGFYFITYIFLQSFAIPGSIFLSILSGFLFPFPLALTLVCLCSGLGASFCYLLSYLVGRRLVAKYIPERVAEWQRHYGFSALFRGKQILLAKDTTVSSAYLNTTIYVVSMAIHYMNFGLAFMVNNHREHLLNYIIFLRITPFLPNWFINITSPVINVPLVPFFFGTFIGVAPPSFVAIHAGTTLQQLTSSGDTLSWTSIAILSGLAILSLLPVFFKKRLREKFE